MGTSGSLASNDGFIDVFNATTSPTNGDNEIYIEIYDQTAPRPPASGTWTFTFTPVSMGATGVVEG
jgi:hypothetical protein